jgi:hypothetical protein
MSQKEKFPVHESIEVLEGETIYKTEKWWLAVLKTRSFGRISVNVYLWLKRGDSWKRQQKLSLRDIETWKKIKENVDKLLGIK